MRETFKAAVLFELKKPLEIIDLYHQDPSDGEVKVKMITSGLCGAQVNEMSGKKGDDKYLPHLMGHEGYGEVVAVGKDVSTVKVGDHVILHWRVGKGIGTHGTKYESVGHGPIGAGPVTTFAEFTIISENRCSVIKSDSSISNSLPLLGCAVSTAYGAVVKEAKVEANNDVLIYGAGGLGMALLFWCKLLGIKNVTVLDIHDGKKPQVEEFGGAFINASEPLAEKAYDVVFETSGVVENVEDSLRVAKKSAKIILIGQTKLNAPVTFDNFLHFYDEISMIASAGGRFNPDEDMEKIYSLCKQNMDLFNSLVSQTINLDQVNEGFELMKAENTKRVIINF